MAVLKKDIETAIEKIEGLSFGNGTTGEILNSYEKEVREIVKLRYGEFSEEYSKLMEVLNSADLSDLTVGIDGGKMTYSDWTSVKKVCLKILNSLKN